MQHLNNFTSKAKAAAAATRGWFKRQEALFAALFNALTIVAFTLGIVALIALVWLYVRPEQTADIKVPVATDKANYYPGQAVSGIFFGDTYYRGEVSILREVFCKNYKGIIAPPASAADGNFFSTQAIPRHLEGESVSIGNLPANIPVGANCVIQFTNVYQIQTPFGIRHLEYQYYTQNFAIITKARSDQLACEAAGNKNCDMNSDSTTTTQPSQSSPETAPVQQSINSQDNPAANSAPAPRYIRRCSVDFIVQFGCHEVQTN